VADGGAEHSRPVAISTTGLKTCASIPVVGRLTAFNQLSERICRVDVEGRVLSTLECDGATRTVFESATASTQLRHSFEVGLSVSAVSGSFYRSKIVSLAPRMVLVNKTGFVLEYTQSAYHKIASPSAPVFWLPSASSSQLTGIDVNASRALHVHDAPRE